MLQRVSPYSPLQCGHLYENYINKFSGRHPLGRTVSSNGGRKEPQQQDLSFHASASGAIRQLLRLLIVFPRRKRFSIWQRRLSAWQSWAIL
jgi:hypothetical protein